MAKKKKKIRASKATQKSQALAVYTPVLRLRSQNVSPLDSYLMKHVFLPFDGESAWQLTSNCKICKKGTGYII